MTDQERVKIFADYFDIEAEEAPEDVAEGEAEAETPAE